MSVSSRVLVLGLGNDILTDDAVGLLVAREVRRRLGDTPGIAVRETTEMGLTLLDEIVDCGSLILVDAVQTGCVPPGQVHEIGPDDLPQVTATSPHFVGVGETLALGATLGLAMPRRVRIFAIEVADPYTLGTQLTTAVAQAVPEAAERVVKLARSWM
ncbi:MAG: hydrogenase maturation protease [Opitutaceae bacterium]|nr:hydrogenase maturation protease [Opitutaceae bacterium]